MHSILSSQTPTMIDQLVTDTTPTSPPAFDLTSPVTPYGRRILILTAEIGAGHTSTAWALRQLLEHEDETARVEIDEPLKRVAAFSRLPRLYRFMIAYLPAIWALFYYSRKSRLVRKVYGAFIRRRLRPAFAQLHLEEYDTVVITYSMYCNCIESFTDAGLRTVVLVTDLFGGPHEWFSPGAHQYIVPTPHMESMAKACSIAPKRILLRRLPTLVSDIPPRPRWSAERRSALRILVIGGSEGLGPLKATATGILRSQRPAIITVVCGNNVRLRRRLQRSPVSACGFIAGVATRYQDYDLVVTKPGSVTLMELFQQNVPFVLLPGIPGIEAGNTRWFKNTQLPQITGRRAAQSIPERLVNSDLSLSPQGTEWIEAISQTQDALPEDYVTIDEVSPVYRAAKLTA